MKLILAQNLDLFHFPITIEINLDLDNASKSLCLLLNSGEWQDFVIELLCIDSLDNLLFKMS